jgi:hypothetical protein
VKTAAAAMVLTAKTSHGKIASQARSLCNVVDFNAAGALAETTIPDDATSLSDPLHMSFTGITHPTFPSALAFEHIVRHASIREDAASLSMVNSLSRFTASSQPSSAALYSGEDLA